MQRSRFSFRIPTNTNTPVDPPNKKGSCVVPADMDSYPLCHASSYDVPVTAAGGIVSVKFSSLTGGAPSLGVSAKELLGLEWAFSFNPSSATGYAVDVTIDDVQFTNSAGGSGG